MIPGIHKQFIKPSFSKLSRCRNEMDWNKNLILIVLRTKWREMNTVGMTVTEWILIPVSSSLFIIWIINDSRISGQLLLPFSAPVMCYWVWYWIIWIVSFWDSCTLFLLFFGREPGKTNLMFSRCFPSSMR